MAGGRSRWSRGAQYSVHCAPSTVLGMVGRWLELLSIEGGEASSRLFTVCGLRVVDK